MAAEKDIAMVLRSIEFSETSLIVTLMTRGLGKIHALAKGARRLKSPFESALDLLAVCRIVFLRKSSDALDLLTEAKLQRSFRVAAGDLRSLYAAYYVVELLEGLTDDYDPHPELFDLADQTLLALSRGDHVARRVLRFELGALGLLGHRPSLEMCVECGRRVEVVSGRVAFGQLDGGVICADCRPGKRQIALVGPAALRTMARLADPTGQAWQRMEIAPPVYGEVRGVMNHYVSNLLGRRPRLHAYLGSIGM